MDETKPQDVNEVAQAKPADKPGTGTRPAARPGTGTAARPAARPGTPTRTPTRTGTGTPTRTPANASGTSPVKSADISPQVIVEPITSEVQAPNRESLPKSKEIQNVVTNQSALIVMALLDGIASMMFGPDAMMLPPERQMLSEPLERILSRMEFTQTEAVKKYTDPILFVMGLMAWGSRIARQQAAKKPKETPIQASQRTHDIPGPAQPPQPPALPSYNADASVKSLFPSNYMTSQERTE